MAQSGSPATQDMPRRELYYPPGVAILVALAFAVNAWLFYRLGNEEASNVDAAATPPATIAWTVPVPSSSSAPDAGTQAQSAQQAVTATDETAKPAATDARPAAKHAAKAKAANRMLAKATRPATQSTTKPVERSVALLSHPKPAYPAAALREREQGTVLVLAQVDVAGHVSDARVVRRSGSYVLDRAAMNEVRRWQFEPALHDGRPIVASVQVPVNYRLQD
ncbi:MAG: energy transducer TonB [Rudaea sp.]|uniref:energy transducer TonB n=1 Tax=Rudaea sp. TaxID=2136325 RepID=UPI0039E3BA8E